MDEYNQRIEEGRSMNMEEWFDEAEERGRIAGRMEGEGKLGRLMDILAQNGKLQDIREAATNADRRQQLYMQYGIV